MCSVGCRATKMTVGCCALCEEVSSAGLSLETTVLQQECDDCMSLPQSPAISRQQAFSAAVMSASGSMQAMIGPAPMRRPSTKTPNLTAVLTSMNSTQPPKAIQMAVFNVFRLTCQRKVSCQSAFHCKQWPCWLNLPASVSNLPQSTKPANTPGHEARCCTGFFSPDSGTSSLFIR